jgi:hypothetical protein
MPSDEDVTTRTGSLRAMTGLTEQAFQALLPPFEQAFVAYMHDHTIDGQPRTVRRYSTYDTCPLPTIADKLLFMLTYVKQHPIQAGQGQLFGMSQSNTNQWIHLLHAVLNQALAHQELLPARTADELAVLLAAERTKVAPGPPLVGMMARSDRSTALPLQRTSRNTIVARKKCPTIKTLLASDETCHMCFLSATYERKVNEKSLADLEGYTFPPRSCLDQDMGFQGYTCEGMTIVQPKKKPPGGELPPLRRRTIARSRPSESVLNTRSMA